MGGGPKASAANLEPLGKRRAFGVQNDYSTTDACASSVSGAKNASNTAPSSSNVIENRSVPLSPPAGTTPSYNEGKEHATYDAKQTNDATSQSLINLSSLPLIAKPTISADRDERPELSGVLGPARYAKASISRVPSPRTRLETSARALALAHEWQAKFKGLPKKVSAADSQQDTYVRQSPAPTQSEQDSLAHKRSQQSSVETHGLGGQGSTAAANIVEELSRKHDRKSDVSPQGSVVDLDNSRKLGNLSPRSCLNDRITPSAPLGRLSFPLQYNFQSGAPTKMLQLDTDLSAKPHTHSLNASADSSSTDHVVGKLYNPQTGQGTIDGPKAYISKAEDHIYEADRYHHCRSSNVVDSTCRTSEYQKIEDINKREYTHLERAHSPSLQRKYYGKTDYRHGRNPKSDRLRADALGKDRYPGNSRECNEASFHKSYVQHASTTKDQRHTYNDGPRGLISDRDERQYSQHHSYRDRRHEAVLVDDCRNDRDGSLRDGSPIDAYDYHRDRSTSPRRSHYGWQSWRDHQRDRSKERRHREGYKRHSHEYDEHRPRIDYERREYHHRNSRRLYNGTPQPARHDRYESNPRQCSPSRDHYRLSGYGYGYKGHTRDNGVEYHRDSHYRTRDIHRY